MHVGSSQEQLLRNLVSLSSTWALCSVLSGPGLPEQSEDPDDAVDRLAATAESRPEHQPRRFLTIASADASSVHTAYHETLEDALAALSGGAERGDEPLALLDLAVGVKLPLRRRTLVDLDGYVPVELAIRDEAGEWMVCLPMPGGREAEWQSEQMLGALGELGAQAPPRSVLWLRVGDVWLHPMDTRTALAPDRVEGTAALLAYIASYAAVAVRDQHRLPPWHADHIGLDTLDGNGAAAALIQRVLDRTRSFDLDEPMARRVLDEELDRLAQHFELDDVAKTTIRERLAERGWPHAAR